MGLLLAILATGCAKGPQASADNHGYGWEYEAAGASGVRFRYQPQVAADERAGLDTFEAAYAAVEACLGRAAHGPLVVVVPRGTLDGAAGVQPPPGQHVGGLYFFDTDLVVVTASLYALRHEMVHYLLDQSGFPMDRNRNHQHAGFTDCVGPTEF
jgi:hypothetical protein